MEKYAKKSKSKLPSNKSELHNEIAKVAVQVLKKNQEFKSFDAGFGTTVDNVGVVQKLTTIPQNDTDSGRDGDALRIVRTEFKSAVAYSDTTNVLRIVIVRWNQDDSSSAPTAVTDVLQTATPFSPYSRDNLRAKKFTIWHDHLYAVSNVGPGVEKHSYVSNAVSNIAFQATATTGTGHLYAFIISDSSGIPHPSLNFVHRTTFTDS